MPIVSPAFFQGHNSGLRICLRSHALNTWWKENLRVSRLTFDYLCRAVGPVIRRQDTILRAAIPVETRAAVGLWRLATGDSYRSCGLMFGIAKSTAIGVCQDFVQALCQLKDEFIKFPNTTAAVREKIEGFKEKSDFPIELVLSTVVTFLSKLQ